MNTRDTIAAYVETPEGQRDIGRFQVRLRIENRTGKTVPVLNPKMGKPAQQMNWRNSDQAYQISQLMSFHYLSLSVADETGHTPISTAPEASGTPAVWPPIDLAPGDSMMLAIPLGEFYALVPGRTYDVTIEYGEQGRKINAQGRFTIPEAPFVRPRQEEI